VVFLFLFLFSPSGLLALLDGVWATHNERLDCGAVKIVCAGWSARAGACVNMRVACKGVGALVAVWAGIERWICFRRTKSRKMKQWIR
jgi:hypothetical protein